MTHFYCLTFVGSPHADNFGYFYPWILNILHLDLVFHLLHSLEKKKTFEKLDSCIAPETTYQLLKIIHRPHWTVFIGTAFCWKGKLFSLGPLSSKEVVPKKTTESEVCARSSTGTLFLQRYHPFFVFQCNFFSIPHSPPQQWQTSQSDIVNVEMSLRAMSFYWFYILLCRVISSSMVNHTIN